VLQEAERIVLRGPRQEAYGPPTDALTRVAGMWSALFGWECSPRDVALALAALKLARESNAHYRDNLVDLAGYALMADIAARGEA